MTSDLPSSVLTSSASVLLFEHSRGGVVEASLDFSPSASPVPSCPFSFGGGSLLSTFEPFGWSFSGSGTESSAARTTQLSTTVTQFAFAATGGSLSTTSFIGRSVGGVRTLLLEVAPMGTKGGGGATVRRGTSCRKPREDFFPVDGADVTVGGSEGWNPLLPTVEEEEGTAFGEIEEGTPRPLMKGRGT